MKNIESLRKSFCLLFFLCSVVLQAQNNRWNVNIHDYQYDMTIYAQVMDGEVAITDYTNLEVGAFVGDECRGIAEVQQAKKDGQTYTWLSIRVKSNASSGENITFRMYDSARQRESAIKEQIPFTAWGLVGMPSNPQVLSKIILAGDVNDDAKVNIADVACILSYMAGKTPPVFMESAADVNKDKRINIADAARILSIMAGN